MDIPWGSEPAQKFLTNVGLITSDGPFGPNVMACEWTHHISYSPGLIAISVGKNKATAENISKTKEFGVNICSTKQSVMSSVTGNYTGKEVDKIKVLEELGFKFYKAKQIKTLMIADVALNVECKVIKEISLEKHILFIGEAQEISVSSEEPLIYNKGKYWLSGDQIQKPPQGELDKIKEIVEKFRKA